MDKEGKDMLKKYLEAGQIVSTHGLRGEVNINPWCDSPEFLAGFDRLYFKEGSQPVEMERMRPVKSLVIAKIKGVDDVNEAMKLIKSVIYIDRADVELPDGSYFEQDLLGLKVYDANTGASYGRLTSVLYTGANDVYGVTPEGGKEVLIPAVKEVVQSVDLEAGRMLVTPIKGLFDDED